MNSTVTECIISFFEDKVSHLFGVSGANIEQLFNSVYTSSKIEPILARHEAMAGNMAIGSVKAGRECGLVAVTSGGGSFNVIPSLAEAYSEQIPLFVIAGAVDTHLEKFAPFQMSNGKHGTPDLFSAFSSVSRWCKELKSPDEIGMLLTEGYAQATARNSSGPAVLIIPKNFFSEITQLPLLFADPKYSFENSCREDELHAFQFTNNTILILGSGVKYSKATSDVIALAEKFQTTVVTTTDSRDTFPNNHPLYRGVLGVMGHDTAYDCVNSADQIIVIGTSLPMIDSYKISETLQNSDVVTIGTDELFSTDSFNCLGMDIQQCCETLLKRDGVHYRNEESIDIEQHFDHSNAFYQIAKTIEKRVSSEESIFIDAGSCGAAMVHYLTIPHGTLWDIALGMGGMGYTFGASIGTTFTKKTRSWVLVGDGSFFMHGLEIHTAIEHDLPITYILFDNSSHGMCSHREEVVLKSKTPFNNFKSRLNGNAFSNFMNGANSYQVNNADELSDVLDDTKSCYGVVFVIISIDASTEVPFTYIEKS